MILYRLFQTKAFTLSDMLVFPLLIGVPSIIFILVVNKYFLQYSFKQTFNEGDGAWEIDFLFTIGLLLVYFIILAIDKSILMQLLPNKHVASQEVINGIIELSNKPLLMLIWFGPVLWIGIGMFEEIMRVFAMKCLWNISSNKIWQFAVIIIVSVVIGLTHLYQGSAGVISIGLKSLVIGAFYYKFRRIYPLVIAHALYDGIQFALAIIALRGL
jgi:hypothetical protein